VASCTASSSSSSDPVRAYLRDIGRYPLLSEEEELLLARQVQARERVLKGNPHPAPAPAAAPTATQSERERVLLDGERARQRMINANLRLVVAVAKKHQRRGLELLDLVQEGNLGLERAVERFDPTRGFRFSTYAYWWIRQSITRALACQGRTIRLPVHVNDTLTRIRQTQRQLESTLGRDASLAEIATTSALSEISIRNALQQRRQPVSLEARVGPDQDTALSELLEDPQPTPEQRVARLQLHEAIETLLQHLSAREGTVIRERFGLDDDTPRSLNEIGARLRLSRERVRQIETRALLKLRQPQHRCSLRDHLRGLS